MILKVKTAVTEPVWYLELEAMSNGEVAVKAVANPGTTDEDFWYLLAFRPDGTFYRDGGVPKGFGFELERPWGHSGV